MTYEEKKAHWEEIGLAYKRFMPEIEEAARNVLTKLDYKL